MLRQEEHVVHRLTGGFCPALVEVVLIQMKSWPAPQPHTALGVGRRPFNGRTLLEDVPVKQSLQHARRGLITLAGDHEHHGSHAPPTRFT